MNDKMIFNNIDGQRGMTLIELLVVITLASLLTGWGLATGVIINRPCGWNIPRSNCWHFSPGYRLTPTGVTARHCWGLKPAIPGASAAANRQWIAQRSAMMCSAPAIGTCNWRVLLKRIWGSMACVTMHRPGISCSAMALAACGWCCLPRGGYGYAVKA